MTTTDDPWSRKDQDAYQTFLNILSQYGFKGFGEIATEVRKMIVNGVTDYNVIELGLRQTDAWKVRFAGNEIRVREGLNALSVADYLATEDSYMQIMHQSGLPAGFYDEPSDFADFIGKGVSPDELNSRVGIATDLMNRDDPAINDQLRRLGMSQGDILARWIDPDKALPILQRKYQTILIGAAAERAGVTAKLNYADHLASLGITEQQAAQGYGTVAEISGSLEKLGDIYGEKYSQRDAEKEVFENSADALKKRLDLTSQERAAFSGSSGTGQHSLDKQSAGSY